LAPATRNIKINEGVPSVKKNDLIALLQKLPGNPEMKLWNGFVEDWMDISGLVEGDLVKYDFNEWVKLCRFEQAHNAKDWSLVDTPPTEEETARYKQWYRTLPWECGSFVTVADIKSKRYRAKRVVYINAKRRGLTQWDRWGDMKY
jgi:hypothetical protein